MRAPGAVGLGQSGKHHLGAFLPGEGVLGRARLPGRAEHHDGVMRLGQAMAQQRHVPLVHGFKAADEEGGVVHGSGLQRAV